MQNLKELLADWNDFDIAQYYLACSLGLMNYDDSFINFREAKHVFWTNNEIQNVLSKILAIMVENSILEFNGDEKYRWNPLFKGTWESDD